MLFPSLSVPHLVRRSLSNHARAGQARLGLDHTITRRPLTRRLTEVSTSKALKIIGIWYQLILGVS